MAATTDPTLRDAVVYSVFVRNHTPEGTFAALGRDVARIRALGVDVVWLMPIHPIGVVARKGSVGSPYAIRDYRSVDPAYGTLDDLRTLVDAIHAQGMRCIIDVVYNHTSPDSVLHAQHPEYFYQGPDGAPCNHVGEWCDIIDLDYAVRELWDYQVETLCRWAAIVDGFRCDVASVVPIAFWERARAAVAQVRPDAIWLAETLEPFFAAECRLAGVHCATDAEVFRAFDMEYAYDTYPTLRRYLEGGTTLSAYLDLLNVQDTAYAPGYNKLRFLENHDRPRVASLVRDASALESATALLYFQKGATLLYAGQERAATHLPNLFERDVIDWRGGRDLAPLLRRLRQIKRDLLDPDDSFFAEADDGCDVAVCVRDGQGGRKLGVFSLAGRPADVAVPVPDATYDELVWGGTVDVRNGRLHSSGRPLVIRA